MADPFCTLLNMSERTRTAADVKIGVRPQTKTKFDAVAKQTRRKLVDVAELAIDALIGQERKGRRDSRAA